MTFTDATPSLILASQSRYRRELLARLQIAFVCESPTLDEEAAKGALLQEKKSPYELATALATLKADSIAQKCPGAWVIGSDQILNLDGEILGKAASAELALRQLKKLSGKTHELVTAWTLIRYPEVSSVSRDIRNSTHISRITLRELSSQELERYVAREKPFDCAGSYKMESLGISLVESVDTTDFTSIIGLPLIELSRHLREIGFNVP